MKKILNVLILICLSLLGCISEEEKKKAQKYMMEYVYITEYLELKDKPYSKTYNFVAKYSTDRFRMELTYLNLDPYFAQDDEEKITKIHKSLVGFSVEMRDKNDKQQILLDKITKTKKPYFSMASPSVFLTADYKLMKGHTYEIKVVIPAKKDTDNEFLRPMLVAGVAEAPSF